MDIDVYTPLELPAVLRTLRTALAPEGALNERERRFLATYARITGHPLGTDDPEPLDVASVPALEAHAAKRLVQLAALAVLLSRPIKPASLGFLQALAGRLDVHDPVVDAIAAVQAGRHLRARLITMRRMLRVMLHESWLAEGPMGVLRVLGAMLLKARVNRDRLWKFKRLGLLPEGTLGREYWAFMTREGFGFPGDVAGVPVAVSYHDVAHVLAEHPATPIGEIQQGSFQGGNRREGGFAFVQFTVLQFHHGVRVTQPGQVDHYDPELLLWAIHRGACCNVDMTHQWDYWPLMALPLSEARERVALLPRLGAPAVPAGSAA